MRIKDLEEIEKRVGEAMNREKRRAEGDRERVRELRSRVSHQDALIRSLEEERENALRELEENRERGKELLEEAEREAESRKRERRDELEREYKELIRSLNQSLPLGLDASSGEKAGRVRSEWDRARKSNFLCLGKRIEERVVGEAEDSFRSLNLEETRMDLVIGKVKVLNKVLACLGMGTDFYLNSLFKETETRFSFHFLEGKDTNRMDKPEWYLDYLLKEIRSRSKMFSLLTKVDPGGKYREEFITMVLDRIVSKKIEEPVHSSSHQKSSLILNHFLKINLFLEELRESYNYGRPVRIRKETREEIVSILRGEKNKKVSELFKRHYREWIEGMQALLKELHSSTLILLPFVEGIEKSLLMDVMDRSLSGIGAFLRALDYQSAGELGILGHFVDHLSLIEEDLLEVEHDLAVSLSREVVLDLSYLYALREELLELTTVLVRDRLSHKIGALSPYKVLEEAERERAMGEIEEEIESIRRAVGGDKIEGILAQTIDESVKERVVPKRGFTDDHDLSLFKEVKSHLERILKRRLEKTEEVIGKEERALK
jgi:RINT-1 / TIP-1 family